MPKRFHSPDPFSGHGAFRTAISQHQAIAKAAATTRPLDPAELLALAAFENHKQFAAASALTDLAVSARMWLKRVTGRNFKVTLEPEETE